MHWENALTLTGGICGLVFVVVGVLMYRFPPKKINHFYGYRTSKSMKSQDRWDFAQKFSSVKMIKAGVALLILAVLGAFVNLDFNPKIQMFLTLLLIIGSVIYLLLGTEKALDKRFKE
ncbi:MAG TPA: hypothetical protein DIV44_14900 [Leeuwenhoekiella sp.]|uniref:SdpI family protein n=1 Tax=Leeuwenhoekiella palythoae TaxID=573501 RepID=UPI000E8FA15C|nr:SdpI family protein [Leeuwenhoekiella palythoae]UBZ11643.1 SdpI family protein [Leeuwenhoekiella palythoae]HAX14855.1 hypothetical protein [Leeuwenhoekiella sp.]HBO29027.1 hypothetical protein [Leeuwenhoekiella sp.]HCQ78095.1 hypothetical protein [Leeuwenhoekiella sp.]|tara:strand:+ start:2252 stop:2605 length:354 start_codon:yes stop_codon:yes gene_type:complete